MSGDLSSYVTWSRLRLGVAGLLIASAVAAAAPVAQAATCPQRIRGCVMISGSRVLATGTRAKLPYVVVTQLARRPPDGAYVYVTPGSDDPGGFGGVVVGAGSRRGRTVIMAVAPLPTASEMTSAARRASSPAAGGSPVGLLTPEVRGWLAKNFGELGCGTGAGDFPVKVSAVGLGPAPFELGGPTFAGANVSGFGLSGQVSPSMALTLGLNGRASCDVKRKPLIDVQVPPPEAPPLFAGPVPYSVRTSVRLSAHAALRGSATGEVLVGTTVGAAVAADGVGLRWAPKPSAKPFATVSQQFAGNVSGTASANVSLVTRLLIARLWGPRLTLGFGWRLKLTGHGSSTGQTCADVSFPAKLGVGLSFNPGLGFATRPIGDRLARLAAQFNGELEPATLAHIVKVVTPGGVAVTLNVEARNIWRVTEGFDTPDLVDFRARAGSFPLAPGASAFGVCPELTVKGLDPTLQCSRIADGCVHGPPTPSICGEPTSWSRFSVQAKGLVPDTAYDVTLGGTAHGVTENRRIGQITADPSGSVDGTLFTLPYIPAHDPWTLTARPRDGGESFTTTLETGEIDCIFMQAGDGAFRSLVAAVGLTPDSSLSEIVDGSTAGAPEADASGTVPTTEIDGRCKSGKVNVLLSGHWLDHGPFTDNASDAVNQRC